MSSSSEPLTDQISLTLQFSGNYVCFVTPVYNVPDNDYTREALCLVAVKTRQQGSDGHTLIAESKTEFSFKQYAKH